jgi:hypothetical protein
MASYVKSTNFAVKDGLPSGDPLKVVKGTEIDTEFNNIATAVQSKADLSSPTFLGTPFAPTASFGTSTNQLATTAFVQAALQALHPVGSIYINATNSANPSTYFGFGTWVAFGAGRVPVGFNASDPLFDSAEETGGSKDATVVSHTHSVTDPGHTHSDGHYVPSGSSIFTGNVYGTSFQLRNAQTFPNGVSTLANNTASATTGISVNSTGSSGTNANLQPYITVFMWKRTA